MKIEIDLKVILLLILFIFTAQVEIYTMFIFFILFHEIAHILVGFCLGMRVTNIKLNMLGFSAEMYSFKNRKSYVKIFTYLSGPIFNLICALVCNKLNIDENLKFNLVYTNAMLFLLNMLPIVPLDRRKNFKGNIKKIFWK